MPVATLQAPFGPQAIQNALNAAYPNYNGVTVNEVVPDGTYTIQWGTLGKQKLLVLDISQATYSNLLAQIPVGDQVDPEQPAAPIPEVTTPPNKRNFQGMWLLGVPGDQSTYKRNIGILGRKSTLTDGTYGEQITSRYLMCADQFWSSPASIGETHPNFSSFRLDRYENVEERGAMVAFDWVGYKKPADRMERMQQNRSLYFVPISILNGALVDYQICSVSISTSVRVNYKYWLWTAADDNGLALPGDGPYGSVIHFVSIGGFTGQKYLFAGNGFGGPYNSGGWHPGTGTTVGQYTESWSRRRWHSDIWEQASYLSG